MKIATPTSRFLPLDFAARITRKLPAYIARQLRILIGRQRTVSGFVWTAATMLFGGILFIIPDWPALVAQSKSSLVFSSVATVNYLQTAASDLVLDGTLAITQLAQTSSTLVHTASIVGSSAITLAQMQLADTASRIYG